MVKILDFTGGWCIYVAWQKHGFNPPYPTIPPQISPNRRGHPRKWAAPNRGKALQLELHLDLLGALHRPEPGTQTLGRTWGGSSGFQLLYVLIDIDRNLKKTNINM